MTAEIPAHLIALETTAWQALHAVPLDLDAARAAAVAAHAAVVAAAEPGGRYALEMAVKQAVRRQAG